MTHACKRSAHMHSCDIDDSSNFAQVVMLTCAAKGLNGKELAFLHAHPLLPTSHYGHALAAMYVVRIYGVAAETPDRLDLQMQH